jgi:hypothetical protein
MTCIPSIFYSLFYYCKKMNWKFPFISTTLTVMIVAYIYKLNNIWKCTRGVGYMDVVEALLPYRNATNIFLQISKNVSYFKILINLRTYITYNEDIASFNVLHKPFIRIYQLFSCWILAYEKCLEAKPVVASIPFLLSFEFGKKTGFCLSGS